MSAAIVNTRGEATFRYTSSENFSTTGNAPERVTSIGDVGSREGAETITWAHGGFSGRATVELVGGVVYLESSSVAMLRMYFELPARMAAADAGRWLSASPKIDRSGFAALSAGLTVGAVIKALGCSGPYALQRRGDRGASGLRRIAGFVSGIQRGKIPVVFAVATSPRPVLVGGSGSLRNGATKGSFSWKIDHFGERVAVHRPR